MATESLPGIVSFGSVPIDDLFPERPEHDAWWSVDLAAAPSADLERLATERRKLTGLQSGNGRADAAHAAARRALIAARVAGRPAEDLRDKAATAQAEMASAAEEMRVQAEVVTTLERQLVTGVRAGRAKAAQAHLDAVRARYDARIPAIEAARVAIAAMAADRAEETIAAAELATANRETYLSITGGSNRLSQGIRHITIPESAGQVRIALQIPGGVDAVVSDVAMLARRAG